MSTNRGRPVTQEADQVGGVARQPVAVRRGHERAERGGAGERREQRADRGRAAAVLDAPDRDQDRRPREVEEVGERHHHGDADQHPVAAQEPPALPQLLEVRRRVGVLVGAATALGARPGPPRPAAAPRRRRRAASTTSALAGPITATRPPASAAPSIDAVRSTVELSPVTRSSGTLRGGREGRGHRVLRGIAGSAQRAGDRDQREERREREVPGVVQQRDRADHGQRGPVAA